MDTFLIEAVDMLDIEKLVLGHDSSGDGKGWYLEEAILKVPVQDPEQDPNTNNNNNEKKAKYKEYKFSCKQ